MIVYFYQAMTKQIITGVGRLLQLPKILSLISGRHQYIESQEQCWELVSSFHKKFLWPQMQPYTVCQTYTLQLQSNRKQTYIALTTQPQYNHNTTTTQINKKL